jgi:hypothetical protein
MLVHGKWAPHPVEWLASMPLPERMVCGYIAFIPVLWAIGLNLPVAFLVIFGTLFICVRSRFAWLMAVPWLLVGVAQFISVLINWGDTNLPVWMLGKHLLASYVSGWLLLGAAIGVGASGIIRLTKLQEAIVLLTVSTAILAIPALILAYTLPGDSLFILTPVGHLVPSSLPSHFFRFGMFFYSWDDIGRFHVPRISLFYPWSTALGFAGVCTVFVLSGSRNGWQRVVGILGGTALVAASVSRTSIVVLIVCVAFRMFLSTPGRVKLAACFAVLGAITAACLWTQSSPWNLMVEVQNRIKQTRPGASEARDDVYAANWEGIRQSPMIGHGWPGEAIDAAPSTITNRDDVMLAGSHSTFSGLIYKGGAMTFGIAVLALIFTCVPPLRTLYLPLSRDSLTLLLGVLISARSEGVESLVFPTLFAFLWLGIALSHSWVAETVLGRATVKPLWGSSRKVRSLSVRVPY